MLLNLFRKNRKNDNDYPERYYWMSFYRKVLDGTMYDCLPYPFTQSYTTQQYSFEENQQLGSSRVPIAITERRPSVRQRLCKTVVDDSISLLFGEGRFPVIKCDDKDIEEKISQLIMSLNLNAVMVGAAMKGSTGSVAIQMKVIDSYLYFNSMYTECLTPKYNPMKPNELISITEKYKITGKELKEKGYTDSSLEDNKIYWFMRVWDQISETYYNPLEIGKKDKKKKKSNPLHKNRDEYNYLSEDEFTVDNKRTVTHNLGFVPFVWIKNLPGNDDACVDGYCTFRDGIETNIELDYQLSQCGRGLKYSQEPLLMIRNCGMGLESEINLNQSNVIQVDEGGDVKHVEISGEACLALLEYAKRLRDIILENIHGNRVLPEKMHVGQSGTAMKLLNQALIWLADKLRISYGEFGLKQLLYMIVKVNQETEIKCHNLVIAKNELNMQNDINLVWPDWFEETPDDRVKDAQALSMLTQGSLLSKESAILSVAKSYDVVDIEEEMNKIYNESESSEDEEKDNSKEELKG